MSNRLRLSSVASVKKTLPTPNSEPNFFYAATGDVNDNQVLNLQKIEWAERPSRANLKAHPGDVLVAKMASTTKVLVINEETAKYVYSTGFACLEVDQEKMIPAYLGHWLRTLEFQDAKDRLATGATQRAITDKSLLSLEVPVPDLEKQRIAVKALDLAEGLRENCKKQIFLILELRTSLLMKQLAKQPLSSNALKNIIDVDDRINYGVVQPGNSVPNGVPMIRITDLSWERIDRSNLKSISKEIERSYERSRIRGNEILMTCVGNIGTIALVSEEDIGSNIARAVSRIPITNERLRVFVAAYLSSPIAQAYFQREARTVAQATLNIDQLKEISIPIYPPDDLDSFHGWSSRVGSLIELARVEEQKLLQLVSSIQNKVFK